MTNAHVVAGADRRARPGRPAPTAAPRRGPGRCSTRRSTSPCSTSTEPRSPGPALRRAGPERGALGATLGYPGGGALTVVPAAVAGALSRRPAATSTATRPRPARDPRAARRDRPGRQRRPVRSSSDGTVGGVVFAEARTDPTGGLRPGRRPRSATRDRAGHRPDGGRSTRATASAERCRATGQPAGDPPSRGGYRQHDRPDPAAQETPMPDARTRSDPAKRHSAALTDGPDRAGARVDAQGHRLHRRGPGQAARRRRRRPGSRRCRATTTSAAWPSTSRPASARPAGRRWSSTRSRSATA